MNPELLKFSLLKLKKLGGRRNKRQFKMNQQWGESIHKTPTEIFVTEEEKLCISEGFW